MLHRDASRNGVIYVVDFPYIGFVELSVDPQPVAGQPSDQLGFLDSPVLAAAPTGRNLNCAQKIPSRPAECAPGVVQVLHLEHILGQTEKVSHLIGGIQKRPTG